MRIYLPFFALQKITGEGGFPLQCLKYIYQTVVQMVTDISAKKTASMSRDKTRALSTNINTCLLHAQRQ